MNDKKDDKAPADGDAKAAGPKKPLVNTQQLIFIGILVAVVVINIVVAFVLVQVTRPVSSEEKAAKAAIADSLSGGGHGSAAAEEGHGGESAEEGEPIEDPIEAIVNIAGTDGERFLKIVLLLCYDAHKYPKMMAGGGGHGGGGGIGAKKAVFKDFLIEIVSQMTLSELAEPEAKTKIRKDFLRRVNSIMSPESGEFSNVLIDEFLIQ